MMVTVAAPKDLHAWQELVPLIKYPYWRDLVPGAAVVVFGVNGQHSFSGYAAPLKGARNDARVVVKMASGEVREFNRSEVSIVIQNLKASF